MKCPSNLVRAISNWMYSREVKYIIDNETSINRRVSKGLPQDVVLSPILYNIYTCDIGNNLPDNVAQIQFADDIAIYCCEPKFEVRKIKIEKAMDIIGTDLNNLGLELQTKKTNIIDFNKKGFYNKNVSIRCINDKVYLKREAKFLGILMDNQLNFKSQCQKIKEKVIRANGLLRYVNRTSRGLEVNTSLLLYKSLIRSILDYGLFIYFPNKDVDGLKIERAQYLGLRTALGFRNSTPTNVIIAEAKVMTLKHRASFLAKNFTLKVLSEGPTSLKSDLEKYSKTESTYNMYHPWRKISILADAWKSCKKYKPILNISTRNKIFDLNFWSVTHKIISDTEIGKNFNGKNFGEPQLIKSFKETYKLNDNALIIYTDGSKIEDNIATGSAFYVDNLETGFYMSLHRYCNNFTAEACAIAKALEWTKLHKIDKDILLLTDSLSTIKAIINNRITSYVNDYLLEIKSWYFELQNADFRTGKNVVIGWIPAHKGIYGNEKADELAKIATEEAPNLELKAPIKDIRRLHREELFKSTIAEIKKQAQIKGSFYFNNFFREEERKPWFFGINAPRRFTVLINRLRAYHYNLNSSLSRIGYIESPRCRCGHENEDINHLVFVCSHYDEQRINLNKELDEIGASRPDCVWSWLRKEELGSLKLIYKFIVSTGRII